MKETKQTKKKTGTLLNNDNFSLYETGRSLSHQKEMTKLPRHKGRACPHPSPAIRLHNSNLLTLHIAPPTVAEFRVPFRGTPHYCTSPLTSRVFITL